MSFSFFPSYFPFLPCPSPCPSLLLYGLLFASIQLQTILCVWQRKRFYCVVTPGGIWCLWCCRGQASPGKVNYLWPTLQGEKTVRHTSAPFPLASNRIGPGPEVPTLPTTVHLSITMPLMGTSYRIQIYRLLTKSRGNRRHFVPQVLSEKGSSWSNTQVWSKGLFICLKSQHWSPACC